MAGTLDAITMVEAGGKEVSDDQMLSGLEYAHNIIKELCHAQNDFMKHYVIQFPVYPITVTINNA